MKLRSLLKVSELSCRINPYGHCEGYYGFGIKITVGLTGTPSLELSFWKWDLVIGLRWKRSKCE